MSIRRLLATAAFAAAFTAHAAPIDDMVAFDATYIPALSQSSAASQSAAAEPRARATLAALQQAWPALRARLSGTWGNPDAAWNKALERVDQHLLKAAGFAAKPDWKEVHEALEPVRIDLMQARRARGMDYFVDLLTEFHEPMEDLALPGASLKPEQVDAARRAELRKAYDHALKAWDRVRRAQPDYAALGLSSERAEQLKRSMTDETEALAVLGRALDGGDAQALLKAAAGLKPPFAKAYTAFGRN